MAHSSHKLLLGAHMSITGGLDKALERGHSIGCTTIQLFTKSNRQWHAKKLTQDDIDAFNAAKKKYNIAPIVAHASYLINIGSPNADVEKRSLVALAEELERCEQLGIPYLVLHPGSHLKTDEHTCLDRIARNLTHVLKTVQGTTTILVETMAGQGSAVGYSFEHVGYIVAHTSPQSRIGVCLDTCHIYAAGYEFNTPASYKKMWHQFDTHIGRHYLKAIHLNDSKKECGSRVDRHEHIGKGAIGNAGFALIMNDESLFDVPKILETPKESLAEDVENMKVLKKLLSHDTQAKLGL